MSTQIARIPLAVDSLPRAGIAFGSFGTSFVQDSYVLNGMVEQDRKGKYITRRPGITFQFNIPGSLTPAQGFFEYNGFYYLVGNDVLYRTSGSHFAGTDATAFTKIGSAIPWAARAFQQALVFNDRIYIISGTGTIGDVWSTPDGINWQQNAGSAPFGFRSGFGVCVFNNLMWVIAGSAATATTDVWSSLDGTNWTQVTNTAPWGARTGVGLVVGSNGMYLMGGYNGTAYLQDVWFSPDGNKWTQVIANAAWSARQPGAVLFFNSLFWMIGGFNGSRLNDVWSSPDCITWTLATGSAFSSGISGMGAVVYNNKMWVLGGTNAGGNSSSIYSSATGTSWALVTSSPGWSARSGLSAVVFKTPVAVSSFRYQSIWIMAGVAAGGNQKDVWYGNLDISVSTTFTLSPLFPAGFALSYQFSTYQSGTQLVIKGPYNLWALIASMLVPITDPNYPTYTVPGVVVLNGFVYVWGMNGYIVSCKLNDVTTWPALQYLYAGFEDNPPVYLAKYLNYIVAFSQYTMQFFYDAGLPPPGISIAPIPSMDVKIGCAGANTVVQINNNLFWCGQGQEGTVQAFMFNGTTPQAISTIFVEKWMMEQSSLFGFTWVGGGHTFYVVSSFTGISGQTFWAYDLKTGFWSEWTMIPDLGNFTLVFNVATTFGGQIPTLAVLGGCNGAGSSNQLTVYNTNSTYLNDNGTPFQVVVQTDNEDAGVTARKFWGRTTLRADQTSSSTVTTIYTTDDDYQTWQTRGTVDESLQRPDLVRMGSSRKRAHQISRTDSNPLRWREIEVEYSIGES